MNEFFGISMTWIMLVLLGLLAVALLTVAVVFFTNRVMFMVGVRNIPRRRAQTTLIIVGLMLSTLIISAAFSIGDTADHSISNTVYNNLDVVDEVVQAQSGDNQDDDPFFNTESLVSAQPIEEDRANDLVSGFLEIDGVDGALAVIRGAAAANNVAKGQTEPLVLLLGLNGDHLQGGFESGLESLDGGAVSVADLASDGIFVNESAADELDIEIGDRITLFVNNAPTDFTVEDILVDRLMSGSMAGVDNGFVLPLERAQQLYNRPGEVDFILVSNEGGVRDGASRSESVTRRMEGLLLGTPLAVSEVKARSVEQAAEASSQIVTLFVVLGLFSIAAGMLLIFLIFVMLAAERRTEMGMSRAVGTKRRHLVQMFMSEGMVYNVGAAAVGCALGVIVSIGIVRVMAELFADFGLNITFNVTARSLIISYCIGVVLTFLTVTFSSWRIGNINIVAAIRDTDEPTRLDEPPGGSTIFRTIIGYAYWLVFKARGSEWIRSGLLVVATIILLGAGGALTAGDPPTAQIVVAVLMQIAGVLTALYFLFTTFRLGFFGVVAGIALVFIGLASDQAFFFGLGWSALIFGAALVFAQIGLPARPTYSAAGILLLVSWLLLAGGDTPFERINTLEGDIEMFFLSGLSMVLAATFVIVYNADLLLGFLTWAGSGVSSLIPSIRTAVAYPLANKFRTGMTIAMISLVMFALVMMSTMNENFDQLFSSDEAVGPYAIMATENPGNPLPDFRDTLEAEGFDTTAFAGDDAGDDGVDAVYQANRSVAEVSQVSSLDDQGRQDWSRYPLRGMSADFMQHANLTFQQRATGFNTDADVWQALRENPDYAVVDAFAIPTGGFGGPGAIVEGLEQTDLTFDPIAFSVRDSATGTIRTVRVIGVLSTPASGLFNGMWIPEETFNAVFDRPEFTIYMVRLDSGADAGEVAQGVERTLLSRGVQAESLRKIIEDYQAQSRSFLYLIQGFMGIGLFVGIAAVGVIAFRTVVERRQQIGMLRAIGYSRRAVALSFIMESSFTALLGIVSGIGLALLLAYQLVNTDEFVPGGVANFYIPWLQIVAIGGFAFLASIVMTIIPSRQASGIPIAEALRYE